MCITSFVLVCNVTFLNVSTLLENIFGMLSKGLNVLFIDVIPISSLFIYLFHKYAKYMAW